MPSQPTVGASEIATLLGPLSEERARIERVSDRLGITDDLTERADLGSELVRSVSRYEDTFERALLPRIEDLGVATDDQLGTLDDDREALRDAMDEIHQRSMGIDPRNVHASDGQGFEDRLTEVVVRLRPLLALEDGLVAALMNRLSAPERMAVANDISHAFKSASERPRPPRTAVGRFLSNAHVKLDHTFEDVATPQHPGADTVKG